MFCFHKYNKVEDGYQYCKKCGKAIVAPCSHKWELIKTLEVSNAFSGDKANHYIFVLQCSNCGILEQKSSLASSFSARYI